MCAKARPFSTDDERSIWEPNSGCLLWLGCFDTNGYGQFREGGRMRQAHRASYELHKGPIPAGMLVCHTCDNKICINPDHLYVGTQQQNMDDAIKRGRLRPRRSQDHGQAKLTDSQALEIFFAEGSQSKIAHHYGVSQNTVSLIKLGKRKFALSISM